MSGILAILREALSIFYPNLAPQRSLFWNCVIIAFVISASVLWAMEHQKAVDLAKRITKTFPELSGVINFSAVAPAGEHEENTIVTVVATVKNTGTPSIADDFTLSIKSGNRETKGQAFPIPETITLADEKGSSFQLKAQDYLPRKAVSQPIPTGGAVQGFITVLARDFKLGIEKGGTVITLTFSDISGKTYKIESILTGQSLELPDPTKLQKKR